MLLRGEVVALYAWKVRRNFNESVSLSRLNARRSLRGYTLLCCNLMPWIASPSSPGPDFAHETCHTDPSKGSRRRPLVREALETTLGAMDALHDMHNDSERGLGQRGDPNTIAPKYFTLYYYLSDYYSVTPEPLLRTINLRSCMGKSTVGSAVARHLPFPFGRR